MPSERIPALIAVAILLLVDPAEAGSERYDLGRPATPGEVTAWDIDVRPDGAGLPPGRGSVAEGRELFARACAGCHGDEGEGKPFDRLVGGQGTLASEHPVRTVGSYWPYATTLFDYIRRAMPPTAPRSLTADQVYAVSAYILFLNSIILEDAILDAQSLPKVEMPNRAGFISVYRGPGTPEAVP